MLDLLENHMDKLINYHTQEMTEFNSFYLIDELIQCSSHDLRHLLYIQFIPLAPGDLHRPNCYSE